MNDCRPQGHRNRLIARQALYTTKILRLDERNRFLDFFLRGLPAQSFGEFEADYELVAFLVAVPYCACAPDFVFVGLKTYHRERHRRFRQLDRDSHAADVERTCARHFILPDVSSQETCRIPASTK